MKQIVLFFSFLCIVTTGLAQKNDRVILQIGKQAYFQSEFDYLYGKNHSLSVESLGKREYLELFTRYKLKVLDAIAQGLDTAVDFRREMEYYRNELSKPYLRDARAEEEVVAESYRRMTKELDVSHLLIRVAVDATPADTLLAWQQVVQALEELKGGAAFEEVAVRYSQDPSVQQNKGRLGFFTVFQMVYPFETAAYHTAQGTVSEPFRSAYGYHLVKVHEVCEARGNIRVAHIMKSFSPGGAKSLHDEARRQIDSVYFRLCGGEDFAQLAVAVSDDRQSALEGGELPWIGAGKVVPQFLDQAFALKADGDFSPPFATPFGWHIVKRLEVRHIGTLEQERATIAESIENDERGIAGVSALLTRLRKEYGVAEFPENRKALWTKISLLPIDSVFLDQSDSHTLIRLNQKEVKSSDFIQWVKSRNSNPQWYHEAWLETQYKSFADAILIDCENEQLPRKYPEYKHLLQEYHDGLLVFAVSEKKIWGKAAADTLALHTFYAGHATRYRVPVSFKGVVVERTPLMNVEKMKREWSAQRQAVIPEWNRTYGVDIQYQEVEYGHDRVLDRLIWPEGNTNFSHLVLGSFGYGEVQPLNEVKGLVMSDYQNELELRWIESLMNQYRPKAYRRRLR